MVGTDMLQICHGYATDMLRMIIQDGDALYMMDN